MSELKSHGSSPVWQPLRSDLTKGNTSEPIGPYMRIQYPALLREFVTFAGKSPAGRKVSGRSRYLPSKRTLKSCCTARRSIRSPPSLDRSRLAAYHWGRCAHDG